MRIDLRRIDGGMAEELLHRANVGAIREEVGGEGVAQDVRRDLLSDARLRGIRFDHALDRARSEALTTLATLGMIHEERLAHIFPSLEIRTYRILCGRGEEDDAHLLALAAHGELV